MRLSSLNEDEFKDDDSIYDELSDEDEFKEDNDNEDGNEVRIRYAGVKLDNGRPATIEEWEIDYEYTAFRIPRLGQQLIYQGQVRDYLLQHASQQVIDSISRESISAIISKITEHLQNKSDDVNDSIAWMLSHSKATGSSGPLLTLKVYEDQSDNLQKQLQNLKELRTKLRKTSSKNELYKILPSMVQEKAVDAFIKSLPWVNA